MSPTRLVEQKTLEVVSISLERLEEPRELGSVFGGSDQETASSQFPPPWSGLGVNPLGTTYRAETQTNPTIPPLPEEGGDDTAEPDDPSTELLKKGVGCKSRAGCLTCQTCENASSDRISRFAASQSVARLVHDPVEDVGERGQPQSLRQSL